MVPSPTNTATLHRIAAAAGCGSAAILLVNAAKRAEVIPTSAFTPLNGFALAALIGVEFVINLVFKDLPAETVQALRDGPLGVALTTASVLFLLGTLAFVAAMLRSREVPAAPLVLDAVGAIPVSLRAFVPEAVLDLGLVVLAAGIAWLAIWPFNRASQITTWTITSAPPFLRPVRV